MIERISDLPETILGFAAKGKVTAKDYENIVIPAVEELFAERDKIRFLYHLGAEFSGFEPGAMWDDAKIGFKHLRGWERIAVVTDVEWIRLALRAFGVVIPGKVRVFHDSELAEAKHWITE